MKKKLSPLIEEYNKKTLIAIRSCNKNFKKNFIHQILFSFLPN